MLTEMLRNSPLVNVFATGDSALLITLEQCTVHVEELQEAIKWVSFSLWGLVKVMHDPMSAVPVLKLISSLVI